MSNTQAESARRLKLLFPGSILEGFRETLSPVSDHLSPREIQTLAERPQTDPVRHLPGQESQKQALMPQGPPSHCATMQRTSLSVRASRPENIPKTRRAHLGTSESERVCHPRDSETAENPEKGLCRLAPDSGGLRAD